MMKWSHPNLVLMTCKDWVLGNVRGQVYFVHDLTNDKPLPIGICWQEAVG